jgi:hypothetical protein
MRGKRIGGLVRTPLSVVSNPFAVFRSPRHSAIACRLLLISSRRRIVNQERRRPGLLSVKNF